MNLVEIVKVLGWIFLITPTVVFVIVSAYMIKGAMGDDDVIKAIVMVGLLFFFLGIIMLLLIYLTNVFSQGAAI